MVRRRAYAPSRAFSSPRRPLRTEPRALARAVPAHRRGRWGNSARSCAGPGGGRPEPMDGRPPCRIRRRHRRRLPFDDGDCDCAGYTMSWYHHSPPRGAPRAGSREAIEPMSSEPVRSLEMAGEAPAAVLAATSRIGSRGFFITLALITVASLVGVPLAL